MPRGLAPARATDADMQQAAARLTWPTDPPLAGARAPPLGKAFLNNGLGVLESRIPAFGQRFDDRPRST